MTDTLETEAARSAWAALPREVRERYRSASTLLRALDADGEAIRALLYDCAAGMHDDEDGDHIEAGAMLCDVEARRDFDRFGDAWDRNRRLRTDLLRAVRSRLPSVPLCDPPRK